MSCLDLKNADMGNVSEFIQIISSHDWKIAYNKELGGEGIILRYQCARCKRELTSFAVDSLAVS
jgi:hypothetical protein